MANLSILEVLEPEVAEGVVLDLFIGRGGKGDVGIETTDVLCFIHI